MKTVIKLALASLLFGGSVANAALVNFSLIGLVDTANFGNAYELAVGDSIFADGVYDDAGLTGVGTESVELAVGSNYLLLDVGVFSFDQNSDISGGAGFPTLSLLDGVAVGLNFSGAVQSFGTFTSNGSYFSGDDDPGYFIDGLWSSNTSPVPVPAAVWLFGSGLLGLVGVARRKAG